MRAKSMTLRYMGWVQRELAGGKPVWGILIAREFSDRAKFATLRSALPQPSTGSPRTIRRLHTADQALYAAFDTFVRLFLTCIPDPPVCHPYGRQSPGANTGTTTTCRMSRGI